MEYNELGEGSVDGHFEHSCELRVLQNLEISWPAWPAQVRTHEQIFVLASTSLYILKLRSMLQIYDNITYYWIYYNSTQFC